MSQRIDVPGMGVVEFPDGMSDEQIAAAIQANMPKEEKKRPRYEELLDELKQQAKNISAGAVRGAGSIGATLLTPVDAAARAVGVENDYIGRKDRREAMTSALGELGADTSSIGFQGGKLAGEVAGTAGVGSVLGGAAAAVKASPAVVQALQTSGFLGGNIPTRMAAGAAVGGTSAGLVDPEHAGMGALIGGALPPSMAVVGKAGQMIGEGIKKGGQTVAERLMQSAIKPTIKQLKTGDAKTAAQTLLEFGINPNRKGVEKLRDLIETTNSEVADKIANSTATVSKQDVLARLNDTRRTFGQQVAPQGDLAAIQGVGDNFLSHPGFPQNDLPVQIAQQMKQGTYKVLRDKYGQMGSAETEASKALARGLKEEISSAVPGVGALNAQEAKLLTTLDVAERRALMELNKNPMGLAALAQSPGSWALFMADKSALFKSLAARMLNTTSAAPSAAQKLLSSNPALEQLGYRTAPVMGAQ